jgi:transposase
MMGRVEADFGLAKRFAILTSIPGVSRLTAFALLIESPGSEPSKPHRPQASPALLPSRANPDAGPGALSFAADGPASARPSKCQPSFAARFNPDMKAKYAQLVVNGKAAKVALTAIMRKLLVLANALLKNGRTWTTNLA